jgi:hypothetical protein
MNHFIRERFVVLAIAAIVALAALAAAGCGDSSTSSSAKNAQAISAVNILDNAGLHEIDDQISNQNTVPPTADTTATHLQAVLLLTEWPTSQLKDDAKKLADKMATLATALNTDKPDMKAAGAAAHDVHETEHDFSHEVWDYLQSKAGVKAGLEPTEAPGD